MGWALRRGESERGRERGKEGQSGLALVTGEDLLSVQGRDLANMLETTRQLVTTCALLEAKASEACAS